MFRKAATTAALLLGLTTAASGANRDPVVARHDRAARRPSRRGRGRLQQEPDRVRHQGRSTRAPTPRP